MTKQEFARAMKLLTAAWPSAKLPEETIAFYWAELGEFSPEALHAVIRAVSREGREFIPPAGLLRKRLAEMQLDAPQWGIAHKQMKVLIRAGGGGAYTSPEFRATRARIENAEQSMDPIVYDFVRAVGINAVKEGVEDGGNGEARLRDKYRAFVSDAVEQRSLAGLNAPPEMTRIARANESGPTRIGGALGRVVAELEPGRAAS